MLADWLHPTSVQSFVRDYLSQCPYARPSSARNAIPLFGWDTLARLLPRSPDILAVARGKLVNVEIPRSLAELRDLMGEGIGLVIRHAERHDEGLEHLAASLARNIPGQVQVQLFVTPAGTHGFGWHYDDEEVFIVQTAGAKDYFFRDNTVERRAVGSGADFTRFHCETSPLGTARLLAGDWLYIPSRWWHVAKCVEDSLSISLGLTAER